MARARVHRKVLTLQACTDAQSASQVVAEDASEVQRLNKEVAAAEKDLAPLQKRLAPLQAKAEALEAKMDNAGGSPLKKQKEAVAGLQQVAALTKGTNFHTIWLWPPQPDKDPARPAWCSVARRPLQLT